MHETITLPEAYQRYYEDYKRCRHCSSQLRHYLHAFNHYKKYHYKETQRYFIFVAGRWQECGIMQCTSAMRNGKCWAITKPKQIKKQWVQLTLD